MKCFKQMILLLHIPQAVNASGDLCQRLLKHLFQETAPPHHHPGPLQPNGGLGWSGRHRAPETTKREEDEGLEIAGWVLRWSWRGGRTPLLSGHAVCMHMERHRCGAAGRDMQESSFLRQDPSDKDVPALVSPTTINPTSRPRASPLLSLLWNKRSVQGKPKYNCIKMKKKAIIFPSAPLRVSERACSACKKNLLTSHSAGEGDLKPTKIIVTVFSQSQ